MAAEVLGQAGRKKRRSRLQNTVGAWTLEVKSVCIVRIKGGNEMFFQELDYSDFVDNGGLREVNEITWE